MKTYFKYLSILWIVLIVAFSLIQTVNSEAGEFDGLWYSASEDPEEIFSIRHKLGLIVSLGTQFGPTLRGLGQIFIGTIEGLSANLDLFSSYPGDTRIMNISISFHSESSCTLTVNSCSHESTYRCPAVGFSLDLNKIF